VGGGNWHIEWALALGIGDGGGFYPSAIATAGLVLLALSVPSAIATAVLAWDYIFYFR
jgi:hypothetical protein